MALAGSSPHYVQLPPSLEDLAFGSKLSGTLGTSVCDQDLVLLLFSSMSTDKEDQKTSFTSTKEH